MSGIKTYKFKNSIVKNCAVCIQEIFGMVMCGS